MSRIGKRPVALPSGVTATTEGQILSVKGPKGTLTLQMRDEISYDIGEDGISVQPAQRRPSRRAPSGACSARWCRTWSPA